MHKTGFKQFALLVLVLTFVISKSLLSQNLVDSTGFTWRFLQVDDPATTAKMQFKSFLPVGATAVSWDFGDGNTSTENNPVHTYDITLDSSYTVILSYTSGSPVTVSKNLSVNSAFFWVSYDHELGSLATFKRVFRSGFNFPLNPNPDSSTTFSRIGNMRYEWSIDNVVMDEFKMDNTHGHYPNIYYTFPTGGDHTITLKVWNVNATSDSIEFTRTLTITPNFTTIKEKFSNLPNVFTPNGDGFNDYFQVSTSGTSRISFMVFTRSGQLVYQQQANIIKWDGKNQFGKDLPEGIYYYILDDLDKKYETAKGFFYIFRGK